MISDAPLSGLPWFSKETTVEEWEQNCDMSKTGERMGICVSLTYLRYLYFHVNMKLD